MPAHIQQAVDLESLTFCKDSYVDEKLKLSMADVLYQVKFAGQDGYLYVLVEHQSTVDKMMPFRFLKYILRIMDDHLNQGNNCLPVVYPLLFFQGVKPYSGTTDIFDLFGNNRELAKSTLLQPFQLVDVGQIPDEQLRRRLWSGTMEFVFKHVMIRDLLPALEHIKPEIIRLEHEDGTNFIIILLEYILNAAENIDEQQLVNYIQHTLSPEMGDIVMTIAEKLRKEGIIQEKQHIAKKLLEKDSDVHFIAELTDLPIEEIRKLQKSKKH